MTHVFSGLSNTTTQAALLGGSGAGAEATRIAQLEARLSRLSLINQALWELVRDREKFSDDLLALKVAEIDMRDGKLDGRNRTGPQTCPNCKRTMQVGSQRCVYCGAFVPEACVFRGI